MMDIIIRTLWTGQSRFGSPAMGARSGRKVGCALRTRTLHPCIPENIALYGSNLFDSIVILVQTRVLG